MRVFGNSQLLNANPPKSPSVKGTLSQIAPFEAYLVGVWARQ